MLSVKEKSSHVGMRKHTVFSNKHLKKLRCNNCKQVSHRERELHDTNTGFCLFCYPETDFWGITLIPRQGWNSSESYRLTLLMSGSWLPPHASTPKQYMQLGLSPRFAKFRHFYPMAKAQFGQACHGNDETTCLRTEEGASLNVHLSPVRDFSFTKGYERWSECITEGMGTYTQIPNSLLVPWLPLGRDTWTQSGR